MKAAMRAQDNIISAYRVHGWTYLMGVPPAGVLCELTGKKGGCARGKGGSMHMYAPNFYGGKCISFSCTILLSFPTTPTQSSAFVSSFKTNEVFRCEETGSI